MLPVQECSKRAKNSPIFSKNDKFMLTLMSKEKLNFLLQIQILHFKYVWNLPSLSLARFFLIRNESQTMWKVTKVICLYGTIHLPEVFRRLKDYLNFFIFSQLWNRIIFTTLVCYELELTSFFMNVYLIVAYHYDVCTYYSTWLNTQIRPLK